MYIDKENLIADALAFSADATSTNSYDNGSSTPKIDFGAGEPMVLAFQVDVAADFTTGNETYQFNLLQSANADLTSADILQSRVISYALLLASTLHYIPVPPGAVTKRYLGLGYDGGGTTPTITGTAWFTSMKMIDAQRIYPSGYTVS